MAFRRRREALRSILSGSGCVRPGSVYDAISIRIAADLGFELGMFGGSVASLAILASLPLVLGGAPEEMSDLRALADQRVRVALQGHAPFAAATRAVHDTLKALRDGQAPNALTGLASAELTGRLTRESEVKARSRDFLGLKK